MSQPPASSPDPSTQRPAPPPGAPAPPVVPPGAPAPQVMPAPTAPVAPPVPSTPVQEEDYYSFLRTGRHRWWKALLAMMSLIIGFFLLSAVIGVVGIGIDIATGAVTLDQFIALSEGTSEEIPMGPGTFIANNVALAALIPLSGLLQWGFYGQRPKWLSSVAGGFRWKWFGWTALIIGIPWTIYQIISMVLDPLQGPVPELTTGIVVLLVLVLITTPLQAAGEEYAFRGFLPRLVAVLIPHRGAGLVVSALLAGVAFMVVHFAADIWLNIFYFGLGLIFFALVYRTGGLEAAVMLHVVNNLVILLVVVRFGQLEDSFNRSAGVGSAFFLIPLALGAVLIFVTDWFARRRGLTRTAAPGLGEVPPPLAQQVTLDPYEQRHVQQHAAPEPAPHQPAAGQPAPGARSDHPGARSDDPGPRNGDA